jgi:hypothetical protein
MYKLVVVPSAEPMPRAIPFRREVVAKTKEGKYLICELKLNELQVDGSGRFFIGMLVSNGFRTSKFASVCCASLG